MARRNHEKSEPYFMKFCKEYGNSNQLTRNPSQVSNQIDVVKFLDSISSTNQISQALQMLNSPKGKESLNTVINNLNYKSTQQMSSLTKFYNVFGSSENFCGLKKIGIINLFSYMFDIYGFLEALSDCLSERSIQDINPISWFLFVCVSSDNSGNRRNNPTVTTLFSRLLPQLSATMKKLFQNLLICSNRGSITWSLSELRTAEPLHDNDHPDDYRKIVVFPSKQELQIASRLDKVCREWVGDVQAIHTKLLDRQFRYLREDLTSPLKEELKESRDKPKYFLRNPIVTNLSIENNNHRPSLVVSFLIPDFIKTRFKNNEKEIAQFLVNDGERIYRADSIILFVQANPSSTESVLSHIGIITKLNPKVSNGRFQISILFPQHDSMTKILSLLFTKSTTEGSSLFSHAVVSKISFFAYRPILECLQDTTLIPLEEELVQTNPTAVPLGYPLLIPESICNILRNDPSQLNAVQSICQQRVSLIQGPPGTGKTFLGIQIVKSILAADPCVIPIMH